MNLRSASSSYQAWSPLLEVMFAMIYFEINSQVNTSPSTPLYNYSMTYSVFVLFFQKIKLQSRIQRVYITSS